MLNGFKKPFHVHFTLIFCLFVFWHKGEGGLFIFSLLQKEFKTVSYSSSFYCYGFHSISQMCPIQKCKKREAL